MWGWVVGGIFGAGTLAALVYWIRGLLMNSAALDELSASLRVERERIEAQEKAQADARARRAVEFGEKSDSVRSADDAAKLLRDALDDARAN